MTHFSVVPSLLTDPATQQSSHSLSLWNAADISAAPFRRREEACQACCGMRGTMDHGHGNENECGQRGLRKCENQAPPWYATLAVSCSRPCRLEFSMPVMFAGTRSLHRSNYSMAGGQAEEQYAH